LIDEEAQEEGRVQVSHDVITTGPDRVTIARIVANEPLDESSTITLSEPLALEANPERPQVVKFDRPVRRRKPTVAEFIHREHDGPDPATLPRRRRRMRFPKRYEFHTQARMGRAAL
jgi:hypothetical protein